LAARVLFERPENAPLPPRTHMLQQVDFADGAWLVDVAFGGKSPAAPLRLAADVEQSTPRESCRLIESDGDFILQWQAGADWRPLYRIVMQPQLAVDFEPANWLTSTHPDSRFTNNLIAALPGEGRRYTLFNREFRTRFTDGRLETRALEKADELLDVLEAEFSLALTGDDQSGLTDLFPRLPKAA
jgi:N-hydroxyarylamine O-acetyltransferase